MTNNKVWGIVLSAVYVVLCLYIVIFRFHDVAANLEASFIWAVPTFVTSHVVLHKKIKMSNNSELNNGKD